MGLLTGQDCYTLVSDAVRVSGASLPCKGFTPTLKRATLSAALYIHLLDPPHAQQGPQGHPSRLPSAQELQPLSAHLEVSPDQSARQTDVSARAPRRGRLCALRCGPSPWEQLSSSLQSHWGEFQGLVHRGGGL